jgi:hypothetical protein
MRLGFRTIFHAWLSPENAMRSIELAVNADVFHHCSGSGLESVITMTVERPLFHQLRLPRLICTVYTLRTN